MRRLTFALLTFCALTVAVMSVTSCNKKNPKVEKTLKERIQGNTYVITSATLAGATKTNDFKNPDLKLVFSADAGSVTITTGGTTSATATTACVVGENTITLTTPPANPGQWANTLSGASSPENGATLSFTVFINSAKIGAGAYSITCTKQ